MRTLGNILWFIFFGWWTWLVYSLLGILVCITIIGIPIGKAMLQYAKLMACPYGKVIVKETFIKGKENVSIIRRIFGTIANILWLPVGITMFVGNIGLILVLCITIIGIPVAIPLARSCKFLVWPVGAKIISKEMQETINMRNATAEALASYAATAPNTYINPPAAPVQNVIPDNSAQQVAVVDNEPSVDKGAAFKESMSKASAAVAAGMAGAGAALKRGGEKVSASAQKYAGQTGNYLKRLYYEGSSRAEQNDIELSWNTVMQQVESALYRNPYIAGALTFLTWVLGAVTFLFVLRGIVSLGFFRGILYGLIEGIPTFSLLGVLFTVKRNYIFSVVCFLGAALLLLISTVMSIVMAGFGFYVFTELINIIVLGMFGTVAFLLREN